MHPTIKRYFTLMLPFLFIGISIVFFIIGVIIFSYILFIGAIIGLILFIITYVRYKFFKYKISRHYQQQHAKEQGGRVINHDPKE